MGRIIGKATELGVTMGLTAAGFVVLGLWLGRWVDAKLGTGRLATMVLIVAGTVAGQVSIYRMARRAIGRLATGEEHPQDVQEAASAVGLALKALAMLTLPSLAGIALGIWLERAAGIGAVGILLLLCAGLVVGLLGTLRMLRRSRM